MPGPGSRGEPGSGPGRGALRVELFSHPVCSGCREAALALGSLAEAGRIELVQWSLAIPAGRARAAVAGVTSVPSVVVGSERRELASRAALEAFLAELAERGAGSWSPEASRDGPSPGPGGR